VSGRSTPGVPARSPGGDYLRMGWDALRQREWEQARDAFSLALRERPSAEAFEGLSWSAWWLNDADTVFECRERAYNLYREAGDLRGAARLAIWLGTDHVDFRGELAVGRGWLSRARRLLDGLELGPEHGWLLVHEGEKYLVANDIDRARQSGAQAAEIGRRVGLVDLEMMGLATEGFALVSQGAADDGIARLDEAAAAAFGGEFTEAWASTWCGCYVLYACERIRDFERAAQWCRIMEDWCEREGATFAHRVCRAHYAGVLIWNGTWSTAESILTESAARLSIIRPPMAGEATVRLAELRRRQGLLDEAETLFESVAGHDLAILGLGEVCLDRGNADGARARAEEYLRMAPPGSGTVRAGALELLVRAMVMLGDNAAADVAANELQSVARMVETGPLLASAAFARGLSAAAGGDHASARSLLEDAIRFYHRSGAPYESARARIELARSLAALGRSQDAAREARAAATSLHRVGAEHEAARADGLALLFEGPGPASAPTLTNREREILCLIAEGNADPAIARALVLSEHTVHRHVANILTKLGCSSRSAAVAEAVRKHLI
jgi:DNA-binding CsgD family transcriptional regulator